MQRPNTESLTKVVGQNCKRLRSELGLTQDDLARYACHFGLRWRASSVGDFEAGRSSPTLATVIAVAGALQMAVEGSAERTSRRPAGVSIGDLVAFDGFVWVTATLVLEGSTLTEWLNGAAATIPDDGSDDWYRAARHSGRRALEGADAVLARSGLAEQRVAKSLGVEPQTLALWSFDLWGVTFTEERDRRAGPDANKQKRGQITRTMRAELASAIGGNANGDG